MLDRIIDLLRPYLSAPVGYGIVGTATILERSIGAGVVAGETFVILGGFYARLGVLHLECITVAARTR